VARARWAEVEVECLAYGQGDAPLAAQPTKRAFW